MWTLKPRQNCTFWKSSGVPERNTVFFSNARSQCDCYLQKGLSYIILFFFGLAVWRSGEVCNIYWATNLKENNNKKNVKNRFNNSLLLTNIQHYFFIQRIFTGKKIVFRSKLEFWFWLGYLFDQQVKKFDQKRQLAAGANFDNFLSKSEKWH